VISGEPTSGSATVKGPWVVLATDSTRATIRSWYAPASRVQVGVLLLGGAVTGREQPVDNALMEAGHSPLRRKCRLQPRPGEPRLRIEDALESATLYGHEYAVAIVASWPEAGGRERQLVTTLHRAGCSVSWELAAGEDLAAIARWGVNGVIDATAASPRPISH
jgi:hypothetical protein